MAAAGPRESGGARHTIPATGGSKNVFVIVVVSKRPCDEPESYELRSVCRYAAVFQPFVPEGSEKISREWEHGF